MLTHNVKPEVEAFDLSHILKAHILKARILKAHIPWRKGQIAQRPYVQFAMGVKNAMPPTAMCSTTTFTPSTACLATMPRGAPQASAPLKSS